MQVDVGILTCCWGWISREANDVYEELCIVVLPFCALLFGSKVGRFDFVAHYPAKLSARGIKIASDPGI
jgi:hypothetical protein